MFNYYGFMIILSLFLNVLVVFILSRKNLFEKIEIIALLIYENIGIILGGKVFTYLTSKGNVSFLEVGLSSFGSLLGALLLLYIFCIQYKKKFKVVLYMFMPSICLMYGVGKIGCLIAGCCFGIKYNGIGSIIYKTSSVAPLGVRLFPVQLVESILFILLFFFLFIKNIKGEFNDRVLAIGFIMGGVIKFVLDFFRYSHINKIISINQVFCIVFIIGGLYMILRFKKIMYKNSSFIS